MAKNGRKTVQKYMYWTNRQN